MATDPQTVKGLLLSIAGRQSRHEFDVATVPDSFNLLVEGVIDSLGLLELVAELEQRLGVELDLADMSADEISVVGPLSRHVSAMCGARRSGQKRGASR